MLKKALTSTIGFVVLMTIGFFVLLDAARERAPLPELPTLDEITREIPPLSHSGTTSPAENESLFSDPLGVLKSLAEDTLPTEAPPEPSGGISAPAPTPVPHPYWPPQEQEKDTTQTSPEEPEPKKIYSNTITNTEPLILTGSDVLEIDDTHYIMNNSIELYDNAHLIIRNSLFAHEKDYTFQYELKAYGDSKVTVENSAIANSCTGSLNWNFFDRASLESTNVTQQDCNIWHLFTDQSSATIKNHPFNGTFCEHAVGDIEEGINMEIELCPPEGSVVDEELPLEVTDFSFPNENEQNVRFSLSIRNSTIDGWGVSIVPGMHMTLRNSPRLTVGVIVGWPWDQKTVTLDGLALKTYEDQTWHIVDATLRLINSTTYGWEPNVFGTNTLIIKNSEFAGSSVNGGSGAYIIENSTFDLARVHENVTMTIRNSTVGDVIATGDGVITLINSSVAGQKIEEGNGKIYIQ